MAIFEYDEYIRGENMSDLSRKVLGDVKHYQHYLVTPAYIDAGLAYLEAQLAYARTQAQGSINKILSNELADKEVHSGLFKPGVNIYYQVLSEDAFNHLAQQRMQFKDVGAGFVHGEYTHRIQWYVGMYHQTQGFAGNAYVAPNGAQPRIHTLSPGELFERVTLFGAKIAKKYWPRGKVSGSGYLWDSLFDRNSTDVDDTDGITSPEVFNRSLFNEDACKARSELRLLIGSKAATYPTLSEVVSNRFMKRNRGPDTNPAVIAYATAKYNKEGSRYTTLANPDRPDESPAARLEKGVLIPRTG